jgi:hypothetical protein
MSRRARIEDYVVWLAPQIRDDGRHEEFWELIQLMQAKPFEWTVPRDDNRVQDGIDLRSEFCYENRLPHTALNDLGPRASFLEVLIGLSRRVSFAAGDPAPGWAWTLIQNIELHRMTDPLSPRQVQRANEIMDAVIWRNYRPDGGGGFFPLTGSDEDQTQVELWYQMAAYVEEIHPEY